MPVRIEASSDLPAGVAGRWFRLGSGDLIEYDADLPEVARINTVLHEAGHILFGHGSADYQLAADEAMCSVLDPSAIVHFTRVRYRSGYYTDSEHEAEAFARKTLQAILWSDVEANGASGLLAALGFPRSRIG
ncbi:hypothetical protein [Nocardia jejuensis]|uniref:hypothetical protein n=1 Tax=Nocardia jejuensis TaxID=328049 RepID=UPI00082D0008|nr:hypothetical protein [Nocardia jejuensis]